MIGVYQIKSIIKPTRIYIGSSIDIHCRWDRHLSLLNRNKHHSPKLQNHYNKYGKNDLVFSILVLCEQLDLIITEQYYLDTLKPYFNTCKIAGNSLGFKHSKETINKISLIRKKWHEQYFNIFGMHITPCKGRIWKQSIETKKKRSVLMKGNTFAKNHKHSEESKQRMSIARKGK